MTDYGYWAILLRPLLQGSGSQSIFWFLMPQLLLLISPKTGAVAALAAYREGWRQPIFWARSILATSGSSSRSMVTPVLLRSAKTTR